MNILQISHAYIPCRQSGGVVKVVYELSKELIKRGHHVTVITTDGCTQRLEVKKNCEVDVEGVKIWYFRNISNSLRIKFKLATPYLLPFYLKKNIQRYDIIHIHEPRTIIALFSSYYAKKKGIPYIVQPHGSLTPNCGKMNLKKIFDIVWGNDILKHAKKIIAVSQSEVDQFRQIGIPNEMISVIPNGLYMTPFNNLPIKGQFRAQFGIREKHIILYQGRIHKRKGIDFLIHAFYLFLQTWNGGDIILVIAGPDDGYLKVLENLVNRYGITDKIIFADYLPSVDIAYIDADILIYPSTLEIFGLVPFEALIHGTPVIVTDGCGCGEIIRKADCGYLVCYGDLTGLAKIIRYALEHPEENAKKVQAGQKFIKENLVWDKIEMQMEKLYARFI
ncbi:glycosyltransferase [Methanospirillum sp.]